MRTLTILLLVLLLVCGCVNDDDPQRRDKLSTSSFPETTTTSTTMTLDTAMTSSSTTTTTTILSSTCSQTEDDPYACRENGGDAYCGSGWCKCVCPKDDNETLRLDVECDKYCRMIGYTSGSCEVNMFECQVRQMVKPHYVDVLCIDARKDVCCCETNKTVPKYSQLLNNAGKDGAGLAFEEQ